MRLILPLLLAAGLAAPALAAPSLDAQAAPLPKVGDTFECVAEGVQPVIIVVGRVEDTEIGPVVSVSLYPKAGDVDVGHLPFKAVAVTKGCTPAPARALNPNFEGGYAEWREAFDARKGGAWDLPPAQVYATVLSQLPSKP